MTAAHGGTFREMFAVGQAYVEARRALGESERLAEIIFAKPEIDRTRYQSVEEVKRQGLEHRAAVEVLARRATADELGDSGRFGLALADRIAELDREHGIAVSQREQAALKEISGSLGDSGGHAL